MVVLSDDKGWFCRVLVKFLHNSIQPGRCTGGSKRRDELTFEDQPEIPKAVKLSKALPCTSVKIFGKS